MIIEIDDDCVDTIIQHALVKDYVYLTSDLKVEKKNPGHLHPEDKAAYEEIVKSIEILAQWYFIHNEFEKSVKKAKKK